jgi:transposase InsO family protein
VAGESGDEDAVHRARESVGERVLRELQREAARRVLERLNGETFYSLKEAQIVIESWRAEYNTERPHSALGYRRLRRWRPFAQPPMRFRNPEL